MEWSTAAVGITGILCMAGIWLAEINARYRLATMRVGMMTRLSLAQTAGASTSAVGPVGTPARPNFAIRCDCPDCDPK
jgi:hypothetical protein